MSDEPSARAVQPARADVKVPIEAFDDGAVTDMRYRLAVQLVKSPLFGNAMLASEAIARTALDIAEALVSEGISRGWISPLPPGDQIPQSMRWHVRRAARAQALSQVSHAQIAREESAALEDERAKSAQTPPRSPQGPRSP